MLTLLNRSSVALAMIIGLIPMEHALSIVSDEIFWQMHSYVCTQPQSDLVFVTS